MAFFLKRRKKLLLLLAAVLAAPFGLKTCNYVWYRPAHVSPSNDEVRHDLIQRGRYLAHHVPSLSTEHMPWYLPDQFKGEWLAVTTSMTAMALANLAFLYPDTADQARSTLDQLAKSMLESDVREFDTSLWGEDPLDGLDGSKGHIGYLGHLAIVLLAQRYLGGSREHASLTRRIVVALHRRMIESPLLQAETYPGQTFLADNAVVVACLALAQPLFPDLSLDLTEAWTRRVRSSLLDPNTGLMVFRITREGSVIEASRGSGTGWSIFYLAYADEPFAKEQYQALRTKLGHTALFGLVHGIREYPAGYDGTGDVDSGPVILGLSPSGTGFAIAGATLAGDDAFKIELLRTAELVGTTRCSRAGCRYRLAPMVGDAILLAMRTTTPWTLRFVR